MDINLSPDLDAPPAWASDDRLHEHDRDLEEQQLDYAAQLARDVTKKARDLKVMQLAREQLAAEREALFDDTGLYLDRAQLLNLPKPEPLIDRILPRHVYAILRGRDHSFKSFVAIDWALCLATGKPWQGHQLEQTRVLYIAGEGAHGIAGRVAAWEYGWGHNVPADHFTTRRAALNLHTPGPAFTRLLDRIHEERYGLVIIDTLRRVSGAADGNTSEMALVIDNIDRIKQATDNGSVLVVAHTDKGDHDTRGYSGIEDDADVVWAAKRDDMFLHLELTKMKDGPDGHQIHLEATHTLSSLTLNGFTGTPDVDTSESQLRILDAMREYFPEGTSGSELLATSGLTKPTFYRALKDLLEAGQILNTGDKRRKYYELPALPLDTTQEQA